MQIEITLEKKEQRSLFGGSSNEIVKHITLAACSCIQSNLGDNYSYLKYKYKIDIHMKQAPLCKLLYCFDMFILQHL